jgi:hypothetical protein
MQKGMSLAELHSTLLCVTFGHASMTDTFNQVVKVGYAQRRERNRRSECRRRPATIWFVSGLQQLWTMWRAFAFCRLLEELH